MTWQGIMAGGRAAWTWFRVRVTRRRLVRAAALVVAFTLVAVALEALVRAHISSAEARVPTALYTRTVSWGDQRRGDAEPIGTLDGAPEEARVPVRLREVPKSLVDAVLAVEDQRFLAHHGLDLRRIGGAMVANVRAGGIAEGGSTITQQLAKNLFLSASRTPIRKLREAAFAIALEARYDKRTILEAYLNEIYLGQDGGRAIHGVGAASRYYFGHDARRLTLAESAMLAGMINAPNRLAPTRHPEDARARRDLVLSLMAGQGRITDDDRDRASRQRVVARPHPQATLDARYFRDVARAAAPHRMPGRGAAIYTTLDATLQRAAERAVDRGLSAVGVPSAQAALVAIDPRTGEVLAMVGGRDYGMSQFNRATDARRQPGSAFKPIVALAALSRRGDEEPAYTLATAVEDEPLEVDTRSGPWQPANYDHEFRGPVTVREALEQSLNVPFARIGLDIGPERIVKTAQAMGIQAPLRAVPSLALGSSEVSLLELVRAYGVLAAAGTLAPTRVLLGERDRDGAVTRAPTEAPVAVADPAAVFLVTSALEGAVIRGTAAGVAASGYHGALAGKTGTSNDWRDAWFIAYTPSLVVGVWVGNDDGASLHRTGASAAVPIAARFLADLPRGDRARTFAVPDGVEAANVPTDGGGWFEGCGAREYFLAGTAPSEDGCDRFEWPGQEVDGAGDGLDRDWERALRRGAGRLLRRLLEERGIEVDIGR